MQIERVSRALESERFVFIRSDEWDVQRDDPVAWAGFTDSWNRLDPDPYMKPGDNFRNRRFGKFRVDATGAMAIEPLDDCSFFQPAGINGYAGGVRRYFSALEPAVRDSAILGAIVRACLRAILGSGTPLPRRWQVAAHQFRIRCDHAVTGHPTPEGLHRDGHHFISMHLMARARVVGGVSSVCDRDGQPLLEVTLQQPMDSLLLDDEALLHIASPIRPSGDAPGHRDMLVIDYNREG